MKFKSKNHLKLTIALFVLILIAEFLIAKWLFGGALKAVVVVAIYNFSFAGATYKVNKLAREGALNASRKL